MLEQLQDVLASLQGTYTLPDDADELAVAIARLLIGEWLRALPRVEYDLGEDDDA